MRYWFTPTSIFIIVNYTYFNIVRYFDKPELKESCICGKSHVMGFLLGAWKDPAWIHFSG